MSPDTPLVADSAVSAYVARLDAELRLPRRMRADVLAEVRDGLDDTVDALADVHGTSEAARLAVAGFGEPAPLAHAYARVRYFAALRRAARLVLVVVPVQLVVWVFMWTFVWHDVGRGVGRGVGHGSGRAAGASDAGAGVPVGLLYFVLCALPTLCAIGVLRATRDADLPDSPQRRRRLVRLNLGAIGGLAAIIAFTAGRVAGFTGGALLELLRQSAVAVGLHAAAGLSAFVMVAFAVASHRAGRTVRI